MKTGVDESRNRRQDERMSEEVEPFAGAHHGAGTSIQDYKIRNTIGQKDPGYGSARGRGELAKHRIRPVKSTPDSRDRSDYIS
jgi:hypothetical protein